MKAQHVSNSLYGLQSLGDSAEVRGILAEYMPLDDDGVPGSKQFNIQSDGGALV